LLGHCYGVLVARALLHGFLGVIGGSRLLLCSC